MAMGLGAFIAAALGMAATGAAAEVGRQKADAKAQTDKITREFMLGALQQYMTTPGDFNPEVAKGLMSSAGIPGGSQNALVPVLGSMKQQMTERAMKQEAMLLRAREGVPAPDQPGGAMPGVPPGPGAPPPGAMPTLTPPMPTPQGPTQSAFLAAQAGSQGALAPAQLGPIQPGAPLTRPATLQQGLGIAPTSPLAPAGPAQIGPSTTFERAPQAMQPPPPPAPPAPPAAPPTTLPTSGPPRPSLAGSLTTFARQLQGQGPKLALKSKMQLFDGSTVEAEEILRDPAKAASAYVGYATRQGASPVEMMSGALAGGLIVPPELAKQHNEVWYAKNVVPITQRHLAMTADPIEAQQNIALELQSHGYTTPALQQAMFKTQRDVDKSFQTIIGQMSPQDQGTAMRLWSAMGNPPPSAEARTQALTSARQSMIQAMQGTPLNPKDPNSPPLGANPAALAQRLVEAGVATKEDEALARGAAPIGQETTETLARRGQVLPLARGLGKHTTSQGEQGGTQPLTAEEAYQQAQREKAQQAGQQSAATAEGSAAGREAARPNVTIPATEVWRYTNPGDLTHPPADAKYRDVGKGSPYVFFTGSENEFATVPRLRDTVGTYKHALEDLKPVYEKGAMPVLLGKLGVVGGKVQIGPVTIPYLQWPAGMLPDDKMIGVIQRWVPGTSKEQAQNIAKAMVDIQITQDLALSIMRGVFNEKGTVRGEFITQGAHALPGFENNWITVKQKYDNYVNTIDKYEKGFGLPGKSAWPAFERRR